MNIQVEHIQKTFGKRQVLQDISFTAEAGSCIGIIGANGCGKSTLFSILAGVQHGKGDFLVDGVSMFKDMHKRTQWVGYIPQGTPLIEELTAYDNLRLWYPRQELDAMLAENSIIRWFGVTEFLRTPVRKMSGGMKKRLSIVCGVAHQPPVIIMDEPTAALDLVCKQAVKQYIEACKQAGKIVVLSTHDEQELALCDQIYLMKNGRLEPFAYTGRVEEIVEQMQ